MTLSEKHCKETKRLVKKIGVKKIAKWFLEEGYYPEQYVLPPQFKVEEFFLKQQPYFLVDSHGQFASKQPVYSNLINVTFPKSQLTDRTFGIMEPRIYHDLVWHLMNEWDFILKHFFNKKNKIVSYSFPIPVSTKTESSVGTLRTGRMIYEFIEMAENDLVAEAHKFKYILKTDVKNCYPSIYTHSISWALHTKEFIRIPKNRTDFSLLGNKLDKLCQASNDGCTNGLPIGPAISDLISEIILTAIDIDVSKELAKTKVNFLGVRFKDDYRFLCDSKADAEKIVKSLQSKMRLYNLSLNEGKSEVKGLPEGLFRPWVAEFQKHTLKYKKTISYKKFENSLLGVLKINEQIPETGVIDRFLSELTSKDYNLKLGIKRSKNVVKTLSLLLLLKEKRARSFPMILAIIEKLIEENKGDKHLLVEIKNGIKNLFYSKMRNEIDNQYDLLWLSYFIKFTAISKIKWPKKLKTDLMNSIKENKQTYFNSQPDIKLFDRMGKSGTTISLLKHLVVFPKE